MKLIPLTRRLSAMVDDEDYDRISRHRWYANPQRNTHYARRTPTLNGKKISILMHREVMGLTVGDNQMIDHINRDGLDNRKSNLRFCDCVVNARNAWLQRNNTSGCKGVCWNKRSKMWQVQGTIKGVRKYCGLYSDLQEAKEVYEKEFEDAT